MPNTIDAVPASPCTGVCTLTPDGRCLGCGRTGAEIAAWPYATETERRIILAGLTSRK